MGKEQWGEEAVPPGVVEVSRARPNRATRKRDSRVLERDGAEEDAAKDEDDLDERDKQHRHFIVGLDPRLRADSSDVSTHTITRSQLSAPAQRTWMTLLA